MPRNPETTVFITAYNYGRFLKDCIDSILSQSYEDYELLVCDNASADNTQDVIRSYNDKRILNIRHEENIGPFDNGLDAIARSRGKYLHPFCADDVMLSGMLQEQVQILKNNPNVGVVSCDILESDENLENQTLYVFQRDYTSGADVIKYCLSNCCNYVGGPSQHLFRKHLMPDPAYSKKYRWISDLKAVLDVLKKSDYSSINRPGVIYRRHTNSDTNINCRDANLQWENWFSLIKEFNMFECNNLYRMKSKPLTIDSRKELLKRLKKISAAKKLNFYAMHAMKSLTA